MSSKSQEPPQSDRLPFEPGQNRKKSVASDPPKSAAKASTQPKSVGDRASKAPSKSASVVASDRPPELNSGTIPAVVSRRMGRRMAVFSGLPTGLGVLTFFVSYLIVTQGWLNLPNVAVLLVSMGWFGLGVVGLSYGVLSTSWDEEREGTRLGTAEFKLNFERLTTAWKSRSKT